MSADAMAEYEYKVRDLTGRTRSGRLRASSPREAAKQLTGDGSFILKLRPGRAARFSLRRTDRRFPVVLCRRLAVMLSAGMTIGEALRVLSEQDTENASGRIVSELYRSVADGETLSSAMERWPNVFGAEIRTLVEAGEKSGTLDILLGNLADSLEADYAAREKLLTLMMYPCVLALAVAAAAGFLLAFVFPAFVSVFRAMEIELPLPTRILLGICGFLETYGWWLLAAGAAAVFGAERLYRRESVRIRADRILLRLPVIGKLAASADRMRISGTLSVLLGSGLVIDQALAITEGAAGNAFFRQGIRRAHSEVQKGYPLSEAFRKRGILSPMLLELLAAGESAGEMEAMLAKISAFCRLDMETRSERVRVLLPPLSLLILGGVVGFIIFSAVMPLLDSMTAFM